MDNTTEIMDSLIDSMDDLSDEEKQLHKVVHRLNNDIKPLLIAFGLSPTAVEDDEFTFPIAVIANRNDLSAEEVSYYAVKKLHDDGIIPEEHWENHVDIMARAWVRSNKIDMDKIEHFENDLNEMRKKKEMSK